MNSASIARIKGKSMNKTLKDLSAANYNDVLFIFKSLNYNKTKAKNVINAAKFLVEYC